MNGKTSDKSCVVSLPRTILDSVQESKMMFTRVPKDRVNDATGSPVLVGLGWSDGMKDDDGGVPEWFV